MQSISMEPCYPFVQKPAADLPSLIKMYTDKVRNIQNFWFCIICLSVLFKQTSIYLLGSGVVQESPCSDASGTCTCSCHSGTTVAGRCPSQASDIKCCYPSKWTSYKVCSLAYCYKKILWL
jgi:hypothetical protein